MWFRSSRLYFTWLLYNKNAIFWKYCSFTSLARSVLFDLAVCCHWSFNVFDAKRAGEMYTPRVGENTVYDSPLLSPTAPSTHFCWLSAQQLIHHCWKTACSNSFAAGLELKYFWEHLNMEGKLKRTEAALRGQWLYSLCVVLMSTFVQTVAFQNHANRRPVLCVALYWWSPLWTL